MALDPGTDEGVIEVYLMAKQKWKRNRDPLYRGDHALSVCVPTPKADDSVIRHVMYLEGPGRETPYLSTTEHREVASKFAQANGIWETTVPIAASASVRHISNAELLRLMKGNGQGIAKWPSPSEVSTARCYVEEHGEHLLDFRATEEPTVSVKAIFKKS